MIPGSDPDWSLQDVWSQPTAAPVNLFVTNTEPTYGNTGDLYFNTSLGKFRFWASNAWRDIYNYTGASAALLGNQNTFTIGNQIVKTGNDLNSGLNIWRNSATQSADLFSLFQSNGSTVLASFGPQGNLAIRNDNGAAGTVPLSVTANATQSVNLFQILASDNSTVRFGVSSAGALTVSPSAGTAATITQVSGGIGLRVNTVSGGDDGARFYHNNGTGYSMFNNTANLGVKTSGATYSASFAVNTNADATLGAVIRGNATSGSSTQTADLFQLQTGATGNAVLAKFDANGALTVSPSAGTAALQVNPPAGTLGIQIKAGDTSTATFKLRNTTDSADLFAISDSGKIVTGSGGGIGSPNAQVSVNAGSSTVGIAVKLGASGSSDLQQWLANNGTTVLAKVDSAGGFTSASTFTTSSFNARLGETSSTGYVRLQRGTAALANPGANFGLLYFREGTTTGTLKLVVRAGAAGAETTILDNIPT